MNEVKMKYEGEEIDPRGRVMQIYSVGRPSIDTLDQYELKSFLSFVYESASENLAKCSMAVAE